MKRTVSLKLITTPEHESALSDLADTYAAACNAIVPFSRENRCWNRVALHHLAYYAVRERHPALGSQMVCQAIRRVADAYKAIKARKGIPRDKPVPVVSFKPTSVDFDKRTYSLKGETLSLFTLSGRAKIGFTCGKHQRDLLSRGAAKQATLVIRKGVWYFNLVVDLPDVPPVEGEGALGVDVGENNIAASSTGKVWGGGKLRHDRDVHLAHRRRLQSNGSRASRRKLKAISGRESRHMKHVNHEVSKAIVAEAVASGVIEIRMEDLTNIRSRIKAGKRVRARLHRWAFRQLQDFVVYKAEAAGLRTVFVDPAYTSRTCSSCGELGRRVKHSFSCSCGARRHSDVNAAVNIAGLAVPIGSARGDVTRPVFAHRVNPDVVESLVL